MKVLNYFPCLLLVLVLFSCEKDEESNPQFSTEEAKQAMSRLNLNLQTDIIELANAEGVIALGDLVSLTDLNDPFGGRMESEESKNWFKMSAQRLKVIFNPKRLRSSRYEEDGFQFEQNVGRYDWSPDKNEFVKSPIDQSFIIINFPSEGSVENNVSLTIAGYTEQLIEDEFGSYYMPTSIVADLLVDGVKQVELSLSAVYSNIGEPQSGNIILFVNPYTLSANFDNTGANQSTLLTNLTKSDVTIVGTSVMVNFFDNLKEEVGSASGFVQYKEFRIQGSIDVNGFEISENPDPNLFVDLDVFKEGSKIGDILFVTEIVDGDEEDVPYIKYADGSMDKLEDLLETAFEEIENLEEELGG